MIAGEAVAALRLTVAAVGSSLSALNAVQLAVIIPAIVGTAYSLLQFLNSLKEYVIQLVVSNPYNGFQDKFQSIFDSDLYRLLSYCCSFKFLGLTFNFYYFAFSTFIVLVGSSITLWAITKFWPTVSNYIYQLAKRLSGG